MTLLTEYELSYIERRGENNVVEHKVSSDYVVGPAVIVTGEFLIDPDVGHTWKC